ncbi:MAG: hypothetical protein IKW08_01000 [Roseburia sp.]|nr:hypothetical protein [Roseburia sp.]
MKSKYVSLMFLVAISLLSGCSDKKDISEVHIPVENETNSSKQQNNTGEGTEDTLFTQSVPDYNEPVYAVKTIMTPRYSEDEVSDSIGQQVIFYNVNGDILYSLDMHGEVDYKKIYDETGNLKEVYDYWDDTSYWQYDYFVYENGRVKERMSLEQGNSSVFGNESWEYDDEGKVLNYFCYDEGEDIQEIFYTYDNGVLAREEEYINDELEEQIEYIYDESGKCIRTECTYRLGNEMSTSYTNYEYDVNGNKVKEVTKNSEGQIKNHYEWIYYDNNNMKSYIQYIAGKTDIGMISNYDINGNLIEVIDYSYETLGTHTVHENRSVYTYDEENRRTSYAVYRDGGEFAYSETKEYIRLSDEDFKTAIEFLEMQLEEIEKIGG